MSAAKVLNNGERNIPRRREPEVVVFEGRPKKKKPIEKEIEKCIVSTPQENSDSSSVLDMKKTRYEVYKFGISGFNRQKMEDARVALAIKLGAKPPKRTYKNYKELMEERKQQRIQQKEDREVNRKMGINLAKRTKSIMAAKRKEVPIKICDFIIQDWSDDKNDKLSIRQIAVKYKISKLTVHCIITRFREMKSIEIKHHSGRPRTYTIREERALIRYILY